MKNNIFIEYDNSKLKNLSEKINTLFKENGYNTILSNNNTSINEFTNLINNTSNPFVLGNKINNDDANSIELIYPLKSDDNLAKTLTERLSTIIPISKYYQLRSSGNTSVDYYELLRNVDTNNAIIIRYGNNIINNERIPQAIFQAINSFLNSSNIYTVQSGDSLYSIARKLNTTVDELKRINNLTNNNLSIGQKLIIPSNNENNENNTDNNNQTIYTVLSGDSLYAIARRFNTTVDELKRINNLTTNNLSIGQKLIIPSNNENNNSNNNQTIYTVLSGDSLYAIARRFNTTVDELKRINNLTTNNLSIGQKLIIP